MNQLLVSVHDNGDLSVAAIDATVPSGMGVLISDMRTDRLLCPVQIKLVPVYSGKGMAGVVEAIKQAQKDTAHEAAQSEAPPRKPWALQAAEEAAEAEHRHWSADEAYNDKYDRID